MKILHIACSPRGQAAESYRLSQKIVGFLLKREPAAILVNRVTGDGTLSHIDDRHATALGATQRTPAEISPQGTMVESEELIQELESSDVVVIGTPMHNFTVPSGLKAWIDHIVRCPPNVQRDQARLCRHATRPSCLCRGVLRRKIFWSTRASAGFSYSVSKGDPRHHRAARSDFLLH